MSEKDWREQRKSGMVAIAVSALAGVALWFAIDRLLPPLAGMEDLSARMLVALKCCALAALFCLFGGVEAVAHERLQSAAFDPLAGHETMRLRINKQYLQNTLEQAFIAVVAHLALATLVVGPALSLIPVAVLLFAIGRIAFLRGYPKGAGSRAFGMVVTMFPTVLAYLWAIGLIGMELVK